MYLSIPINLDWLWQEKSNYIDMPTVYLIDTDRLTNIETVTELSNIERRLLKTTNLRTTYCIQKNINLSMVKIIIEPQKLPTQCFSKTHDQLNVSKNVNLLRLRMITESQELPTKCFF